MSPDFVRATVYAGVAVTDYVRAGSGTTLLMLTRRHAQHPLLVPLASSFRVIAPELPRHMIGCESGACPSPPFMSWLGDFLDGLGILRVSLLADEFFALDAMRFCVADPTRVDRLVLVIGSTVIPIDSEQ